MRAPAVVATNRHLVRVFMFFAVALCGTLAHANDDLASLAGLGSCSDCHADDRKPKKDTLNALGLRYLGCQMNRACYERLTAAVRTLQQAPAGQPSMQRQAAPLQAPANAPPAYVAPPAAPAATAGAPRGSYQSRCRNISLSVDKTNLYGYCANSQNQTVYTRLVGFADCQSDIAVDGDGYLVCNLRGGGSPRRERVIDFKNNSWNTLTQVKMNTGSGSNWVRYPDLEKGVSLRFAFPASTACMVQATYSYGSNGSFTMNTCAHHKVLVDAPGARFE